jgi:hypothetical protein
VTGEDERSTATSDMDYYARMLLVSNPLREPTMRAAIETLDLPKGSRGLDAGCSIGL